MQSHRLSHHRVRLATHPPPEEADYADPLARALSAALEQDGGHIGYKVRPSCHNRGVATAALRLALQKLAAIGVPRALVTCSTANLASARVIEKCGAVRIEDSHQPGRVTRRYWLATTQV